MTSRMTIAVPALGRVSRIAVALAAIAAASPLFAQSSGDAPRPALPSFVDERRLPIDGEAEARRRAAEEALKKLETGQEELRKKVESEAEARRKAEQEAAARRAEEERRQREAAAAEAKRKAEQEAAARRAEVERQQREAAAAEARRNAEEAEAMRKAEDESRRKAAADQLATRMAGSGDCNDVRVNSSNRAAGAVAITIAAPCLAGQNVKITYGRHSFVRAVPAGGNFNFVLDLFEGAAPVAVTYGGGKRAEVDISGADWSGVSKVAVVWSAPVNLDLHALEYLAPRGSAGHVWSKSPGNPEAARAAVAGGDKGHGYMSVVDDGRGEGMKAEVYTFLHKTGQKSGAVTLLIDYESRGDRPTGDYCGNGKLASVEATVIRLRPGGRVDREVVRLGPAQCNQPISDGERYNSDTLSDLIARG